MSSPRSAGDNGSGDIVDAVGDAFQLVAQGLAQLQEALHLEKQEAERKVQEALNLQEEAEHRTQEALRLQEQRAATALREMERQLQEKDDAIRALQQQLEETQGRVTALEERTPAPEGPGGEGGMRRLEVRVNEVEASLQSAIQTFVPRVEALLRQLEDPQSPHASPATAASAGEAPATGGAAAGVGEASSSFTSTSSGAGHQGAAADEEERARQRVDVSLPLPLRVREVELRRERARTSPCPLGEQLCDAADGGNLTDALCLIECGANVNYIGQAGYTALINATWRADEGLVSLLLQRGADANAVSCGGGSSVLHFAASKDSSGRCVELLARAGADVDARDIDGETPLHRAALHNNEEAVRALLAADARRDLKPRQGRYENKTPFDVATSRAVQELLRQ